MQNDDDPVLARAKQFHRFFRIEYRMSNGNFACLWILGGVWMFRGVEAPDTCLEHDIQYMHFQQLFKKNRYFNPDSLNACNDVQLFRVHVPRHRLQKFTIITLLSTIICRYSHPSCFISRSTDIGLKRLSSISCACTQAAQTEHSSIKSLMLWVSTNSA